MGRLAHRTGAVDTPTDDRRMHQLATPLLGGLALYIGWMVPVMLLVEVDRPVWGIIGGATIVAAVGLFDDLYELEPIVKFIGQLLAIGVAIYFDTRITRIGVPWTDEMISMCWKHDNVFTAGDAYAPKHWPPQYVHYANSYGSHKVLFGTDWPVIDPERAVAEVAAHGLRPESHARLMRENALRIFKKIPRRKG